MNWKGKSKDAFIINNMIIYVENPKKFTLYSHTHKKMLQELKWEFSTVSGCNFQQYISIY